jgi:hypothetical protein
MQIAEIIVLEKNGVSHMEIQSQSNNRQSVKRGVKGVRKVKNAKVARCLSLMMLALIMAATLALTGCGNNAAPAAAVDSTLQTLQASYDNEKSTLETYVSRMESEIELGKHLSENVTAEELGDASSLLTSLSDEMSQAQAFLDDKMMTLLASDTPTSEDLLKSGIEEMDALEIEYYNVGRKLDDVITAVWEGEEAYWAAQENKTPIITDTAAANTVPANAAAANATAANTSTAFYTVAKDSVTQVDDNNTENHNGYIKGGFAVFYTWGTITDYQVTGWGHTIKWKGGGVGFGGWGDSCTIERLRGSDWDEMLNNIKTIGLGGLADNAVDLYNGATIWAEIINPAISAAFGGAGGKITIGS